MTSRAGTRTLRWAVALWTAQARTLFGAGHSCGLLLTLALAHWLPVSGSFDQRLARWLVFRLEWLAPVVLLIISQGLITLRGRVEERWAALPMGLGGVFMQRWLLAAAYLQLCLSVLCWLLCARAGIGLWWRQALSAFVSAAFFSALGSRIHHFTGSQVSGWAAGAGGLLAAIAVAGLWCPDDVARQMWLPFLAASSAAGAEVLMLNKLGYTLATVALLAGSRRDLDVPERLLRRPN